MCHPSRLLELRFTVSSDAYLRSCLEAVVCNLRYEVRDPAATLSAEIIAD
jgi:hypothetical protein